MKLATRFLMWIVASAATAQVAAVSDADTAAKSEAATADPFAELLREQRPLDIRREVDYANYLALGAAWVSADSSQFGQYNGYADEGLQPIADLHWRDWQIQQSWVLDLQNIGSETRSGRVEWRDSRGYKIFFTVDSQLQQRNRSAQTPFIGSDDLRLPEAWQAANTSSSFSQLEPSLRPFQRTLERQSYGFGFDADVNQHWSIDGSFKLEQKQGRSEVGAAIYSDAANPSAVLLPQNIDYRSSEFDLALHYVGERFLISSRYLLLDFHNNDRILQWQNPYLSNLGPAVDYPAGDAALALAPDNRTQQIRVNANYLFSSTLRLDLDTSFSRAQQTQELLPYTVNNGLQVDAALPRDSFSGERDTTMFFARLRNQLYPKLSVALNYRLELRDNTSPRDGYRYVRGDGADQPAEMFTVYNSTHDTYKQSAAIEAEYRLPLRSKLTLEYEHEQLVRSNAAVATSHENRFKVIYRMQPWQTLSLRAQIELADLAASEYQWDQDYYSLLDVELINATPDNQRYRNHPLLSQFHLANRERKQIKFDANYTPQQALNFSLNALWRSDDYDHTELGLRDNNSRSLQFSAAYLPTAQFSLSAYGGIDFLHYQLAGRSFRGGVEQDAFAVTPPLPQASDPDRNWSSEIEDRVMSAGVNAQWLFSDALTLNAECRWLASRGEQTFATGVALDSSAMPAQSSQMQQLQLDASYHFNDALTLKSEYQYARFYGRDWARDGVAANSLNNVLTLADTTPDETVHFVALSARYHW